MTTSTPVTRPPRTPLDAGTQRELFLHNRSVPDASGYARILDIEARTLVRRADAVEADAPAFADRAEFVSALTAMLRQEERDPPPSAVFLATEATLAQFRTVVAQFAVDGLTESQSFFPIVQRLPYRSAMAVFRVLVDEFGCGNVDQAHSHLYRAMLADFGLPTELDAFLDDTREEVYAFVNLFYWMSGRAPAPEYFLGGLAYLEASILYAFRFFADGCARLGMNGRYYTEHLHIDNFHSKELLIAIRELDAARPADFRKIWTGARLAGAFVGEAVDAAVARAREGA